MFGCYVYLHYYLNLVNVRLLWLVTLLTQPSECKVAMVTYTINSTLVNVRLLWLLTLLTQPSECSVAMVTL